MTTKNLQAQAFACLQIIDAYHSTPQAQKNFWDVGNEMILDESRLNRITMR